MAKANPQRRDGTGGGGGGGEVRNNFFAAEDVELVQLHMITDVLPLMCPGEKKKKRKQQLRTSLFITENEVIPA